MAELPLISVVVPSFNQARYLREALDSILRQNYPRLEVVVMDGGSTDGSVDIIRSYEPRLTFWQSRLDGGQAEAINAGFKRCSGDVIAWLNSDDFYWDNALWVVADAYVSNPGFGLYVGNGFRFKQDTHEYAPFCPHHVAFRRSAFRAGLDYILQPSAFFCRRSWEDVGGLKTELKYCMDWDVLIRIADKYPVVTINEFLSVSREYAHTKTSTGGLDRTEEIRRMVRSHTDQEITPGGLYYLFETLLDVIDPGSPPEIRHHLGSAMSITRSLLTAEVGNHSSFPFYSDPQDRTFLPYGRVGSSVRPPRPPVNRLPSISIVTPSFNQAQYLGQTLDSVLDQDYPNVELIVVDGGSTDGSVEILKAYERRLKYWVSEPDSGPAAAINKGLARAKGDIVSWLNSDDLLARDALWEVARRFEEDRSLDVVYANALYINENNELFLADHGTHKTGLYYGKIQARELIPSYWRYVHALPQPTVFFRRHLLQSRGVLDESYKYIFDFELFFRLMSGARTQKIERTQAFYRIHASSKTSEWNKFLVELYRFSRHSWPPWMTASFRQTLMDFGSAFMRRRFPDRERDLRYWMTAAVVAVSAVTKIGNPEAMQFGYMGRKERSPSPTVKTNKHDLSGVVKRFKPHPTETFAIKRDRLPYRSVFCSYLWPKHPGRSGGEIRDFHLLRGLLSVSRVRFVGLYDSPPDERMDYLHPYVDECLSPSSVSKTYPELTRPEALNRSVVTRVVDRLREGHFPVPGFVYHRDADVRFPIINAYIGKALEHMIGLHDPDFLFVSPQSNPIVLATRLAGDRTRLIMASYDVESVRMRRLANTVPARFRLGAGLEARRAATFERHNLALYDGVIAVSDLDKRLFEDKYGIDPRRVLTVGNGVDLTYFEFAPRIRSEDVNIVFVGNFGYSPNLQAARRLLLEIMPLVRSRIPGARAWIVGSTPNPQLTTTALQNGDVVTGEVDDVRPFLADASVACIPLMAGSGTKLKVLEAMSAGVPVVCTPLAAEGLDITEGRDVLLGVSNDQIADAIVRLVSDFDRCHAVAKNARAYVEQRHSWDANLKRLEPWLEEMRRLPRRVSEGTRHRAEFEGALTGGLDTEGGRIEVA